MESDVAKLAEKFRGKFVVFDGVDGSGKSTQRDRVAEAFTAVGLPVQRCDDPGGTEVGDRIRAVLLEHDLSTMDIKCETLLFMASRAQLVAEVIRPALEAHKTVLCSRFVSATCAYQGAAGDDPKRVLELAAFAIGDTWPDVTVLIDVDPKEGFGRTDRIPQHAGKNREKVARRTAGQRTLFTDTQTDAMEARPLKFHREVRKIFLGVGDYYPTPVVVVDGSGDEETVHHRILEALGRVTL
ncbi:MAG: dTMP kinase [Phycisphaerae bacterium]